MQIDHGTKTFSSMTLIYFYREGNVFNGKVMFSYVSVRHSVHSMGSHVTITNEALDMAPYEPHSLSLYSPPLEMGPQGPLPVPIPTNDMW